MEVYLNSIEMGKGIYGIKAVANAHFNKFPQELRRRDCALIAATLPNPLKYSSKNPSPYMQKRQQKILREMRNIENSCGWNYQSQVIK
jgi:monofunctional biosynthetic peptidoglycan transglycosylase